MTADDSWYEMSQTDARGHFTFRSLIPGEYVVGINLPRAQDQQTSVGSDGPPAASLYYGGATARSAAFVIKLALDEKRDDLEFIALTQ